MKRSDSIRCTAPWWLRRLAAVVVPAILALGFAAAAEACPTCKSALAENDPAHANLVAGYFYSILFMMSMPFILVGMFGSYAYVIVRKARDQGSRRDDAPNA